MKSKSNPGDLFEKVKFTSKIVKKHFTNGKIIAFHSRIFIIKIFEKMKILTKNYQ